MRNANLALISVPGDFATADWAHPAIEFAIDAAHVRFAMHIGPGGPLQTDEATARRAMRPKRLEPRGFSQASARLRPRLAFGLPQGA